MDSFDAAAFIMSCTKMFLFCFLSSCVLPFAVYYVVIQLCGLLVKGAYKFLINKQKLNK